MLVWRMNAARNEDEKPHAMEEGNADEITAAITARNEDERAHAAMEEGNAGAAVSKAVTNNKATLTVIRLAVLVAVILAIAMLLGFPRVGQMLLGFPRVGQWVVVLAILLRGAKAVSTYPV